MTDPLPAKPGWKTTEFLGTWAAKIFGALLTSGLLADGSVAMRITGAAVFVLAQLGYTWSRTAVKAAAPMVLVFLFASQVGCATTKAVGATALGDVVDCTTSDRLRVEAQFGPTVEQLIAKATGLDGKIDLPTLSSVANSLEVDGWCVVEKAAAQLIAEVLSRSPSPLGAAASPAPFDPADLAAKVALVRTKKFGATRFSLGSP